MGIGGRGATVEAHPSVADDRDGIRGGVVDEWQRVPLPAMPAARGAREGDDGGARLVRAFVRKTAALAPEAAARLAAVRPETIRKWRRRAPRWLKAETARRITAHLAGEAPADPPLDEGFRRAFRQRLRAAPAE